MNVFMPGGSGFVGRALSSSFLSQGHTVTAIGSSKPDRPIQNDNFHYLQADTTRRGAWQDSVTKADTVINLAGRTVSKRWTRRHKQRMVDSRVLTTRHIVESFPANSKTTLFNASAVGYYGPRNDELLTESEEPGTDFLARLSVDWEAEAREAEKKGTRVILARFGIVLGKDGGALSKMIPAFKSFVGGPLGSGMQWFSWIHMEDLLGAISFVLDNKDEDMKGPINFCSPHPVRNKTFAKALGKALGRPAMVPMPAFMLKAALGQMATAMLAGQRVIPGKLSEKGFRFQYPEINKALADIFNK